MDIEIRVETETDADDVDGVVAAAFGSPVEAELVRDIRASDRFCPELTLVATVDGVVVGHVMISGAEIENDDGRFPAATLAPLAVAPEHHGEGIGGALVRAVCARADARGEPMVLLQGDPRYYSRFGFVPSADHGITMDLPDWAPPTAAQVLRLAAWDRAQPGRLVLPPAFDGVD